MVYLRIMTKTTATIYTTKTQTNKPKLTLEGLLMTIFYSEFKSKL